MTDTDGQNKRNEFAVSGAPDKNGCCGCGKNCGGKKTALRFDNRHTTPAQTPVDAVFTTSGQTGQS